MLIEISTKQHKTLLAALRYWAEENYDKEGNCVTAPREWFGDEEPLSLSELDDLLADAGNPGEIRYLLYDFDEQIAVGASYATANQAMDDPYASLPDIVIRPFLTGGPGVCDVDD